MSKIAVLKNLCRKLYEGFFHTRETIYTEDNEETFNQIKPLLS